MELVCIDKQTFEELRIRFCKFEERMTHICRPVEDLGLKNWLDNQDMCELLGITKRTLARYRQKKLVAYYMIDGRTYYKSSEVEAFLNQKGKRMPARLKNQME